MIHRINLVHNKTKQLFNLKINKIYPKIKVKTFNKIKVKIYHKIKVKHSNKI